MSQLSIYSDVKTFFEGIMDDASFGEDFVYDLFAQAEMVLAMEKPWEVLTNYGTTISYSSGDTYLTNYSFSSFSPALLYIVSLNLDRESASYRDQVPMKDRYRRQDDSNFFAVDYKNSRLHLMGTRSKSGTIYTDYVQHPTYPVASGTPPWPQAFRAITAFVAAGILKGAVDADDISARLSPKLREQYEALKLAMSAWDNRLRKGNKHPIEFSGRDYRDYPLQSTDLGV